MTNVSRKAVDTFLKLQHRRLGGAPGDARDTPQEWSELYMGCIVDLAGDLGEVPAIWRLLNFAIHSVTLHDRAPTELYLQWYGNARFDEQADMAALGAVTDRQVSDWGAVLAALQSRFFGGDLQGTAVLAQEALATLRNEDAVTPEEDACIRDVIGLIAHVFRTPAEFARWRSDAKGLLLDARAILTQTADPDEEAPSTLVKLQMLDLLMFAAGDREHLAGSIENMGRDAVAYVAAFAAVIEPFASLADLYAAFADFNATAGPDAQRWYTPVVQLALQCSTLSDVVAAAACCAECHPPGSSDYEVFAVSLMAAHIADLCSPPFAAAGEAAKIVARRNALVGSYVKVIGQQPELWRAAALYLVHSPMCDPTFLSDHLKHWSGCQRPGPAQTLGFLREFASPTSRLQQRLRGACQVRLPEGSHQALARLLANFDHVMRHAETDIVSRWARAQEAAGNLAQAIVLYGQRGDSKLLCAAVSSALRSWSAKDGATASWCRGILGVGSAFNSGLILTDGLSANAFGLLRVCGGISDVAGGGGAVVAAATAAAAAECGEARVALLFCDVAMSLSRSAEERGQMLLELHSAAAAAAATLAADAVEGGSAEKVLVHRVLGRLHNLPQK